MPSGSTACCTAAAKPWRRPSGPIPAEGEPATPTAVDDAHSGARPCAAAAVTAWAQVAPAPTRTAADGTPGGRPVGGTTGVRRRSRPDANAVPMTRSLAR
jgi:hypothetical protein